MKKPTIIQRPANFDNDTLARIRAYNEHRFETMGEEQVRADLMIAKIMIGVASLSIGAIIGAFAYFIFR
jgi:hypothetical protein